MISHQQRCQKPHVYPHKSLHRRSKSRGKIKSAGPEVRLEDVQHARDLANFRWPAGGRYA